MKCIWNKSILKTKVYNYYDDLVKVKNVRTKNILIDAKSYKDLTIYFRRYDHRNPVKKLGLYYHKLIGNMIVFKFFNKCWMS